MNQVLRPTQRSPTIGKAGCELALDEQSALTCKALGSDVGGLSTEGAKYANEIHSFEVMDHKGDEVVKPSVEDNCTEFGLMGDMQPP